MNIRLKELTSFILQWNVIDESLDAIDWALNLNDPDDWQRSKDTKTKELIKINDGEFKYHLDRYKYSKRYDNEDPEFHRKVFKIYRKIMNLKFEIYFR